MNIKRGTSHGDFAVFRSIRQFCTVKSLLSTFTHITYKGVLSQGFCCVQVNSVLKVIA